MQAKRSIKTTDDDQLSAADQHDNEVEEETAATMTRPIAGREGKRERHKDKRRGGG